MKQSDTLEQSPFIRPNWHGKPYYSADAYCKNTYGEKLYKLSLNAGLTCPNRDGTLDTRGCIFCGAGGSGDFAVPISDTDSKPTYGCDMASGFSNALERCDVASGFSNALERCDMASGFANALERCRTLLAGKQTGQRYIAYFQAYTNTYGPVSYLEQLYRLALETKSIAGISIATRPDCLPNEVMQLLCKLKATYPDKFIWVELGLQTIHEDSAAWIRRGYPLSCYEDALNRLSSAGFLTITHVILGLPGESRERILDTIGYLNDSPAWGVKLQLLHVLRKTDLAAIFEARGQNGFSCSYETLEQYLEILIPCLEHLRPDMVIHRLTGDAPKDLLLFPTWSGNKKRVLNTLHQQMKAQDSYQGKEYPHE